MTFACVFPGQGSQSVGMLSDLAAAYPVVHQTFEEASDAIARDLLELVVDGPAEILNQTENTQPALLAAGVAVWRVFAAATAQRPSVMAGHSLGEYTALVCADGLAFDAGIRLVAERGRAMQDAVPAGAGGMAAILGLEDDAVLALCEAQAEGEVLSAVNFNSPGQVVVAGTAAAVARIVAAAKDAGAKRALPLPVSVPSHCELMRPAAEHLTDVLDDVAINSPNIDVVQNVDVQAHADSDEIRNALLAQLYSPVRWVETVQGFAASGVTTILELGPGKVLTGLNKRIDRSLDALCILDPASLDAALEKLENTDA